MRVREMINAGRPDKLALRWLDDLVEAAQQFSREFEEALQQRRNPRFDPDGPPLTTAVLLFLVIFLCGALIVALLERL